MKFLLDTDICIYIIRKRPESVIRRLHRVAPGDVAISSVTLGELEYGAWKSKQVERNRLALAAFLAPVEVAAYDDLAAREYGRLRAHLERAGTPIGSLDALIAAHAVALKCVLVTNNVREFSRVPNLRVQNWAA